MKTSDLTNDLCKAMAAAQNEIKPASKDSQNPHFKNRFSSLTAVWESIREPLTKNGLTIWQDVSTTADSVSIVSRLSHVSGQYAEFGPLTIPLTKKDAQGVGSAISDARRYALCTALCIVSDEDDDGTAACDRGTAEVVKQPDSKFLDGDMIKEMNKLFQKFEFPVETEKAMLKRAGVETIHEFPRNKFKGCMELLNSELLKQLETETKVN